MAIGDFPDKKSESQFLLIDLKNDNELHITCEQGKSRNIVVLKTNMSLKDGCNIFLRRSENIKHQHYEE